MIDWLIFLNSPRTLSCPGHDLEGIHVIRQPEDSNAIVEAAKDKKVIVIGGSFIGMFFLLLLLFWIY